MTIREAKEFSKEIVKLVKGNAHIHKEEIDDEGYVDFDDEAIAQEIEQIIRERI